jgi:Tfp pilus assembly protein PilF
MPSNNPAQSKITFRRKVAFIIFGFFLFFILLEAGLRLGGFILLSIQEYRNKQSLKRKGAYRIMCVGESTTAGQYPPYLEEILNQRHTGIHFSVIDKGVKGANSVVILAQLESNLNQYHPDMVVAMMGASDRGVVYYKDIPEAETKLFYYCKTYRLIRLLWLRILAKDRGEDAFKKAIALDSKNDRAYVELGKLYQVQGKLSQAADVFKKAIALNPQNDNAYTGLGWFYLLRCEFSQAEDLLRQAIELNPKNPGAYFWLGWVCRNQGKLSQAEDAFKKVIALNPRNIGAYAELWWVYRTQGKFSQAEVLIKHAIALDPQDDGAYGALSVLYEEMGKPELAREYAQKANRLRSGYYIPLAVNNYRKLKDILDKKGIRLVCAQYPMRNIESLKKIFRDQEGTMLFVDNEKVFKDAVKKDGYAAYFKDMIGGDFGHCTDKGNRLLAENIAHTILKEVFHHPYAEQ